MPRHAGTAGRTRQSAQATPAACAQCASAHATTAAPLAQEHGCSAAAHAVAAACIRVHAGRAATPAPQPHAQIPGGWAAQVYGGRIMLALSFALWSAASLLTPGSASGGTGGIVAARVCVGVAQGALIPSVHTVLSQVGAGEGEGMWCCCRGMQHAGPLCSRGWPLVNGGF